MFVHPGNCVLPHGTNRALKNHRGASGIWVWDHQQLCYMPPFCTGRRAGKPGHSSLGQPDPAANPGLQQLITQHCYLSSSLHRHTHRKPSHSLKRRKSILQQAHLLSITALGLYQQGFKRMTSGKGSLPTESLRFCSVLRLNARYRK